MKACLADDGRKVRVIRVSGTSNVCLMRAEFLTTDLFVTSLSSDRRAKDVVFPPCSSCSYFLLLKGYCCSTLQSMDRGNTNWSINETVAESRR